MNPTSDIKQQQHRVNLMSQPEGEVDLIELMRKLNRRKAVIFSVFILVIVLTVLFISRQIPLYTATANLMLDTRKSNVVDVEAVLSGIPMDSWALESEMDIIRSRSFLERVTDKLNLIRDPLFNPDLRPVPQKGMLSEVRAWATAWIRDLWIAEPEAETVVTPADRAAEIKNIIIDTIADGLRVEKVRNSYTIRLTFTFTDPRKTAEVVNAVADAYLMDQLEAKFEATRRANEWLAERLDTLRQEVHAAELAVQKVRERGNLVRTKGSTLLEQQIGEINAQLVMARVNRSQAEARLQWVRENLSRDNAPENLLDIIASPEIKRMRTEETLIRRKQVEMSSRYGHRHPEILKINAELNDLRAKIIEESQRIVESLANEVEVGKAKEQALLFSLDELRDQTNISLQTEVELAELERQAEVARTLYENFLSRFRETSDQEQLHRPDARIIGYAEMPSFPSYPNKRLFLGISVIIGLIAGLVFAFVLEILDRGFRQNEQVEHATGLSVLGMIPALRKHRKVPVDYVMEKPLSQMAEAIRAVRAAIQLANVDHPPKIIMATSSLPGEGKTTFCATLARVAAMSGARILLIDGDLRRPSISKILKLKPEAYLEAVLAGDKDLNSAIVSDPASGLHVICAQGHSANSADLLGSMRMRKLITENSESYDMIIIDTPPLMGISDA